MLSMECTFPLGTGPRPLTLVGAGAQVVTPLVIVLGDDEKEKVLVEGD